MIFDSTSGKLQIGIILYFGEHVEKFYERAHKVRCILEVPKDLEEFYKHNLPNFLNSLSKMGESDLTVFLKKPSDYTLQAKERMLKRGWKFQQYPTNLSVEMSDLILYECLSFFQEIEEPHVMERPSSFLINKRKVLNEKEEQDLIDNLTFLMSDISFSHLFDTALVKNIAISYLPNRFNIRLSNNVYVLGKYSNNKEKKEELDKLSSYLDFLNKNVKKS